MNAGLRILVVGSGVLLLLALRLASLLRLDHALLSRLSGRRGAGAALAAEDRGA